MHLKNRPQAAHAASKATTTRMPEKRTTGRLMACKRYSGGLFTCHAYMDVSVGSFQPPYASCL